MIISKPFRSIFNWGQNGLFKLRKFLFVLLTLGLGAVMGWLFMLSQESLEVTISILVIALILILIVRKPLNGLLVWLFFMAFLEQWVEIPLGAGIPDLSFSRFIVIFLGIVMLARAAIGEFRFKPLSLADFCIIGTTIGILLATVMTMSAKRAILMTISIHTVPLVIYFLAKNLVRTREDLVKILMAIALFGFVAGAYAAFEKATGQVLFLPKDKFVEDLRLVRGESGIQLIRGLMGSSGTMGRILAFTIPVTFYIFLEYAKTFRFKALLSLMLFFQFWGIIAAMSRTPWYALLSALFVMQLFYAQFRKIFIVIALLSGVVLWATWDQVSDSDVSVRVNDRTEDLNGRTERWNTAQTMWERKPILGWGFNGFSAESGEFRQDGRRDAFGSTESDYWHILVSTGLAGFVPYILFMLATLMNSIRLYVKAHASDWSGFISSQSLTLFWAVILVHLVVSYTATVSNPLLKIFPFAVAGAIVGSHEFLLKGTSAKPVGRPVGPTTVPEQI